MNTKSNSRTWQILTVMRILAWVAFIGYLIEAMHEEETLFLLLL